jgi:hypothetical protein
MKKRSKGKAEKKPILAKTLRAAVALTKLPAHVVQAAKSAGCQAFKSNGTVNCEELLAFVATQPEAQKDVPNYFVERALDLRANRLLKEQKLREREKLVVPLEDVKRTWRTMVIAAKTKFYQCESTIPAEAGMKLGLSSEVQATIRTVIHAHHHRALTELFRNDLGPIVCPLCKGEIKNEK